MVTIEDLGILRDVTEDDQGRVHVTITPTYSGCPAMETIRDDIVDTLELAGYHHVDVEFVLSPAWSTDDLTDEGRGKLAEAGIAPPGPVRHGPVSLDARRCAARSAAASTPGSPAGSARPPARVSGSAARAGSPSTTSRPCELMAKPQFHPLRVAHVDPLTDDSVAITFAVPPELEEAYRFTHGQHLTIRGDDGERRSFSICTTPSSGALTIGVKKLPGGAFSEGVVDILRPGDELDVMTPAGRFTTQLDPTSAKSYVAIAAGSGITPMISIVSTILEQEPRRPGDAGLRQPHPPHRDVPRRAPRPEGPVPRTLPPRARALTRAAGRRALLRTSRR